MLDKALQKKKRNERDSFHQGIVYSSYWIILKRCHVSLNCLLQIPRSHQCSRQIDVAIDEIRLESYGVSIIVQGFLQLTPLFVDIAKI